MASDSTGANPSSSAAPYEKDNFFDSISCDALDRQNGIDYRLRGAQERNLNTETFGAVALNSQRRGGRGRGGRGRGNGNNQNNNNNNDGEGRGGGGRAEVVEEVVEEVEVVGDEDGATTTTIIMMVFPRPVHLQQPPQQLLKENTNGYSLSHSCVFCQWRTKTVCAARINYGWMDGC